MRARVLHLTPREEAAKEAAALLEGAYLPCESTWVANAAALGSALRGGIPFDLILLGFETREDLAPLREALGLHPGVPVLLLGGAGEDLALEALRAGATEVLPGDRLGRLPFQVRRALAEARRAAALQEAEGARGRLGSLLRAVLDATSEGILVEDLAGRITAYNRKFMSLCGIPEHLLATLEMDKVIQFLVDHFQDPGAFLDEVRHLGALSGREPLGLLKSLEDRQIEGTGRPCRLGGETVGRVFSFRDVTDRERSAERMKQVIQAQRPFLEAAADAGLVLLHGTGEEVALSETAQGLLGLGARNLPRSLDALLALVHPEDAPALRAALDAPRASLEARLRTAAGAWIRTAWTLGRDAGGRRLGAFRDITGDLRGRREAEARAREDWTAALATAFARALRTPLENLRAHLDAIPPGDARLREAQACAGLLSGLLDQAARAALREPAPDLLLDLNTVAERIRPWAEELAGPRITLRWDLQPGLPTLPLSPGHLEPVLMNLLRNAREALPSQGEILVRTALAPGDPPHLVLEVGDTGPGIPPHVRERMFDATFTTRPPARGLGLTVARHLVEAAGGSIQVETGPLRGTTVKVNLPVGGPPG
ncbi:ATP-binding protein [Mesoterricola silvestris]|uniref:histidine kinase n=1 Tax=Mesoterricola silvestris TaxID=2927979 RepID=A0AA48K8X8_9BACT|nr:ATP-binding protein [Mesoterricola silvestris]BDU72816.1 hypothetical protein METEAL_19900 [Mesoterricola silvestris]